jgi:hypothetical protein
MPSLVRIATVTQDEYIEPVAGPKRELRPGDVTLFVAALPLARRAQAVRSRPLARVVASMARARGRTGDPRRAALAAARACGRYGRWFGGLNTCLTRSLVAGALLCGRHQVNLHVGFRSGSDDLPLDGHAWLTVGGRMLDLARPDEAALPYTEVMVIPFGGEGGSET